MSAIAPLLAWLAITASTSAWAFARSGRATRDAPATDAPVVLLRPCAGDEPGLARALASSAVVGGRARVRFLVATPNDAAVPTATQVAAALTAQGIDARVLVTGARAPNRKADQLARAITVEPRDGDVLVVADSDVELTTNTLAALVDPIARGHAAVAWAPPVEIAPRTFADRISAAVLDASLHAFALLSALDPAGMVGKAFAVDPRALASIGGFAPLTSVLGEDMEIARRVRSGGARIEVAAAPARSVAAGRTWADVVGRYGRWLTVLRAQRPWLLAAYPLVLAAAPLQLVGALVAMGRGERGGLTLALSTVAVRYATAMAARARSRRDLSGLLLAPWLADGTLLCAFARALTTRTVTWRGAELRAARGGPLREVER